MSGQAQARAKGIVVYVAGVSWDTIKGTDRHLAEALSSHRQVLWVDPPLSLAQVVRRRLWRRLLAPVKLVSTDGVVRLSVLAPPYPDRIAVAWLTQTLRWLAVRSWLHRTGAEVVGVVSSSPFVTARIAPRPPVGRRVYYATDDFAAGALLMGRTASSVQRLERRRVAEADAVLAVSQPILDRLARGGHVLPNGCDPDAFHSAECHPAPPDVQLARPIAGVVGQLSPRIDLALLEAVADSGTSLLLVGPTVGGMDEDRFAKLSGRDNVAWVGAKSFEDLPPYLGVMDVGLTPYVDTPFNRASFPLKTLEYLSAGLPVVSTPLPAVSALDTDLVSVASCPTEFADVVAAVIAAGTSRAIVDERRQFARRHGWDTRASDLMRVLARPVPRVA